MVGICPCPAAAYEERCGKVVRMKNCEEPITGAERIHSRVIGEPTTPLTDWALG
jgi:hypothetical protein